MFLSDDAHILSTKREILSIGIAVSDKLHQALISNCKNWQSMHLMINKSHLKFIKTYHISVGVSRY